MRKKRFLALVLSTSMIMSSSVAAFAANDNAVIPQVGSATGTASVEGWVDTDVFSVTLPTEVKRGTDDKINQLDFILDPQGLIEATSANKYVSSNATNNKGISGVSGNYGSLYFTTKVSDNTLLSTNSDAFTILNKGAVSVDVALKASLKEAGDITISDNTSLTGDDTSMYLQLVGDSASEVISAGDAAINTVVSGCDGAYSISYNTTDNKYEYVIASANDVDYPEYSFYLKGECNTNADWSQVTNAAPKVEVTWEVKPTGYVVPQKPSIAETSYQLQADTPVVVPVDLGVGSFAATGISKIMITDVASPIEFTADKYSFADGNLTINAAAVNALINNANITKRVLEVTFDDANKTKVSITLRK